MLVIRGTAAAWSHRPEPIDWMRWYTDSPPPSAIAAANEAKDRCSKYEERYNPPQRSVPTMETECGTRRIVLKEERSRCHASKTKRRRQRAVARSTSFPLSRAQIRQLQSRELTPEDYELLLLLDTTIPARQPVDASLYIRDDVSHEKSECSICIGDIEWKAKVGILSCGHCFHRECVERWLLRKPACPMCGDVEPIR